MPDAAGCGGGRPGLRERKKARTRAALRDHALRLIKAQGYAATTVEQIADAAEVSPSTFFRYFPTKEDAVLYDPYDPLLIAAFRAQPADLAPIQALRAAMREVFDAIPPAEAAAAQDLMALAYTVPELHGRTLTDLARTSRVLTDLVAERTGRAPDELAVQTFAGAVIGAMIAVMLDVHGPPADVLDRLDAALGLLEDGLPL